MKMRLPLLPTLIGLALAVPGMASAGAEAVTPQSMGRPMKGEVFALDGIERGRVVTTLGARFGETRFSAIFFECAPSGVCDGLQFETGDTLDAPVPLEQANAWNRDQAFSKAWVGDEGTVWLAMDVTLDNRMERGTLDMLTLWADLIQGFEEHIRW